MSNEVTPLQIKSVSVKQDEEAIEHASVTWVAQITLAFDRDPYALEKAKIEAYFDQINGSSLVSSDPSFSINEMTFRTHDEDVAKSVVEHVTTQAKNLAEVTRDHRRAAADMLSELEAELQPLHGEKDFRPVEG